jgi:hypothetical protein
MGSSLDVTPLLRDGHFVNIGRKKFIKMDGILVHNTNPFDLTIKTSIYVCIYYENVPSMFEDESLKTPYHVEVLVVGFPLVKHYVGNEYLKVMWMLLVEATTFPKVEFVST